MEWLCSVWRSLTAATVRLDKHAQDPWNCRPSKRYRPINGFVMFNSDGIDMNFGRRHVHRHTPHKLSHCSFSEVTTGTIVKNRRWIICYRFGWVDSGLKWIRISGKAKRPAFVAYDIRLLFCSFVEFSLISHLSLSLKYLFYKLIFSPHAEGK